jgi:serine/threonine protein kinase
VRPRFGRWQGVKQLGRGGNGVVWKATDPDTGEVAAVKTLNPRARKNRERRTRFEDEIAFLLAHPDFPGIVSIIDYDPGEGAIRWYAMRFVRPVREALGADAPIETVVAACRSFAATLAELAAQRTHHRDIKPDNLFEDAGEYLVGDFGLVFYPDKAPVTRHGRRAGPVDYMAPEMRNAADTADAEKADVWSLGKTMWVLLTGADLPQPGPHRIDDEAYALALRLEHPQVRELDLLLERMTRTKSSQRPSMAEVHAELDAWLTPAPAVAVPDLGRLRETITAHTAATVRAQERKRGAPARRERRDARPRAAGSEHRPQPDHRQDCWLEHHLRRRHPRSPDSARRLACSRCVPLRGLAVRRGHSQRPADPPLLKRRGVCDHDRRGHGERIADCRPRGRGSGCRPAVCALGHGHCARRVIETQPRDQPTRSRSHRCHAARVGDRCRLATRRRPSARCNRAVRLASSRKGEQRPLR